MAHKFRYLLEKQPKIPNKNLGISEEEIIIREKIAFDKGYEKAQNISTIPIEAEEDIYLSLLNNINQNITQLTAEKINNYEQSLYKLAIAIGEKLSSVILEEKHTDIMKNFINSITTDIKKHQPVTIRVNDKLVEKLEKDIMGCSIVGDAKIKKGDCILTWANGVAERIFKKKKEEIESILLVKNEV